MAYHGRVTVAGDPRWHHHPGIHPAGFVGGLAEAAEAQGASEWGTIWYSSHGAFLGMSWPSRLRTVPSQGVKGDRMTITQEVTASGQSTGAATPNRPRRHSAARPPAADAVSVSQLVDEAVEAGVVDWIAAQIAEQCRPHGVPLDGDGGLLPALAAAAYERVASGLSGPVTIEVTYDPVLQRITADVAPDTSLATLGAACLGLALTAADLHPVVEIRRAGTTFRCG